MNKLSKVVQWVPYHLLYNKIRRSKERYGNYSIAELVNGREVIIDRKNLSVLLFSSEEMYKIPSECKEWLHRGFSIVSLGDNPKYLLDNDQYFIVDPKNAKVVIIANQEKYTDKPLGIMSNYFALMDRRNKWAIYSADGKRISGYFDSVWFDSLLTGESDYYIAQIRGREAIFHKDGRIISSWFTNIKPAGLIRGESNYYVAQMYDKYAIFHKSGKQISDWYDYVSSDMLTYGLVNGKSNYYVAMRYNKKDSIYEKAIFNKNGKQISDWFDWIDAESLVEGKSDYYIAEISNKFAIFHKNGKQISDWCDNIYASGLIRGKTPYYITVDTKERVSYIYKLGTSNKIGPFKRIIETGFINDPTATEIIVETLDGKKEKITKQEVDEFFESKDQGIEQII